MKTAQKIGVSPSLSSFSLPLGCTVNMDGVCVHLPVFVILGSNLFNVPLTTTGLVALLVSVVFASIGAGGVPGGSVFLLFMILENAGFTPP
ncbi:MAG: cation:dicarboxylase symporter family transporter, partial [Thermoguttaceae bacterium]|nr:cation:dicarboxylase symporter family transporter [Thermoguttaceae bacterium]